MNRLTWDSPVGCLQLWETEGAICGLLLPNQEKQPSTSGTPLLRQGKAQINAYLQGERRTFSLPLTVSGTVFQELVWSTVAEVGYGETCSYKSLATIMGRATALRAVGSALGKNPLPILLPCHRVITTGGQLGGYVGGTQLKQQLLSLEQR